MHFHGSISFDAKNANPIVHTEHSNNRVSVAFNRDHSFPIYVCGTTDELSDLVDRLGRVVLERQRFEATRSAARQQLDAAAAARRS